MSLKNIKYSIGIPVYNEEANIGSLLQSLISCGIFLEIIVVSSGSTDSTDEIVRKYNGVTLIREECRLGKVSAIKKIIRYAKGDVILFTDGDVRLPKKSVHAICEYFNDANVLACTGRVLPLPGNRYVLNEIAEIACAVWDKVRIRNANESGFVYPTGYLHGGRREVFQTLDVDNAIINDDATMGMKLYQNGVIYHYCREAVVNVKFPETLSDYFKQKIRTRLGRRQSENKSFLRLQEEELSAELRSYITSTLPCRKKPFGVILCLLDFFCKFIAAYKSHGDTSSSHLWEVIPSTKKIN